METPGSDYYISGGQIRRRIPKIKGSKKDRLYFRRKSQAMVHAILAEAQADLEKKLSDPGVAMPTSVEGLPQAPNA